MGVKLNAGGLSAFALTILCMLAAPAAQAQDPQDKCRALSGLELEQVRDIQAERSGGEGFVAPQGSDLGAVPEFCRVTITVEPAIGIEVWLPAEGWNGRFKGVGGGGYAGTISWSSLAQAVREGFATASTDTGHVGENPGDGRFGLSENGELNDGLIEDFASRALFEMTAKAKQVTQAFYGEAPVYSYFTGCSTGGRQGLMQVQRTPDAYDGVLAGAPAVNWERFIAAELWPQVVMREETGGVLPGCKWDLANAAAIAACDGDDGVLDEALENPSRCNFDPVALQCSDDTTTDCGCLTSSEVRAITKIWDGAQRADGTPLWPGLERGTSHLVLAGEQPFPIAIQHLKWVMQDPDFDWSEIGYEEFGAYFDQSHAMFNAVIGTDDPDLGEFHAAGGKLIVWHGWTDQFIYPRGTIDYVERVTEAMGAETTAEFLRLFMAPGVDHCQGGVGPNGFGQRADRQQGTEPMRDGPDHDIFSALMRWVEEGEAPERVVAAKYVNDDPMQGVARSRPLCSWPQVAVWDGSGDVDDAASFACGTH